MESFFDTKIIVALIAVIVSFVSLIITKETKTSEFRQKWIDNIRDDIADLIGTLTQYSIVYIVQKPDNRELKEKFFNDNNELLSKIEISINKIELRLNPKDDEELISHLNSITDFITIPKEEKLGDLTTTMNTLKEKSHKLLKDEWERVKKGEKTYRAIKYIFGIIVFIFMVYFTYNVYQTTYHTDKEDDSTLIVKNKYQDTYLFSKDTNTKSIYFDKGSIIVNRTDSKEILDNLFNKKINRSTKFIIKLTGYSSIETVQQKNTFYNNYQISLARANNVKKYILDIFDRNNFKRENIFINTFAYSNQDIAISKTNQHELNRKVILEIIELKYNTLTSKYNNK